RATSPRSRKAGAAGTPPWRLPPPRRQTPERNAHFRPEEIREIWSDPLERQEAEHEVKAGRLDYARHEVPPPLRGEIYRRLWRRGKFRVRRCHVQLGGEAQ